MIICVCKAVGERTLRLAIQAGARSVDDLARERPEDLLIVDGQDAHRACRGLVLAELHRFAAGLRRA